MLAQEKLPLKARPIQGEHPNKFFVRQLELDNPPGKIRPEKLLADELKRQVKAACKEVGTCPIDRVQIYLLKLREIRELIRLASKLLENDPETRRSGMQLAYPKTLADFMEIIAMTLNSHRCPEFAIAEDELVTINHKLDLIAGMLAMGNTPAACRVEVDQETGEVCA